MICINYRICLKCSFDRGFTFIFSLRIFINHLFKSMFGKLKRKTPQEVVVKPRKKQGKKVVIVSRVVNM